MSDTTCPSCKVQMTLKARILRQAIMRCPLCGKTKLILKRERSTNRGGAKP